MRFSLVRRLPKKPITNRYLCFLTVFIGSWLTLQQGQTWAQELQKAEAGVFTETEAVRLGLSRSDVNAFLEGEIGIAQSEVMTAKRWPNPELSYTREPGSSLPNDPNQEYFWLTQRFDLSGRRGLRTQAAESRVRAATHGTQFRRIDLEAEIRQRFYEVLQRQRRVGAVKQWADRMEDVESIVRRLEAGGEVSAYDLRRLIRERTSAEARLRSEQASLVHVWERLKSQLGVQDTGAEPRMEGTLLPPAPPAPLESQLSALAVRPDLLGLEQQATAAELEREAAGRWWIPDLILGTGVKQIDQGPFSDSVPLVSAFIPLPLIDRYQPERARAVAQAQLARSQHSLALSRAAGEARGLWRQTNELMEAARRFRAQAVKPSLELVRTAEAAYRGGETGILELLDAYRSMLEADLQALELELSARQAGIELDRLTGRSVARSPGDRNDQGPTQKARRATP